MLEQVGGSDTPEGCIRKRRGGHVGADQFGVETLIGVLRTTLDSIRTWGSASPTSRGYLNYIEGFLGKAGISVRKATADEIYLLEGDESF